MGVRYQPKHQQPKAIGGGTMFLIFLSILLLTAGAVFAFYYYLFSPNAFLKGSTINGIDVSGLKVDRAVTKVTSTWNGNVLKIMENDKVVGEVTGDDLTYDVDQQIRKCLYPSYSERLERIIDKSKRHYELDVSVEGTTKNFDEQIEALPFVKNHKVTRKTENARVDLSDTDFNVIKEIYGDELDLEVLKQTLITSLTNGEETLDYDPGNYYLQPEIKSDSPEIKDRLDYCEKYLTRTITIEGPGTSYTLSPAELNSMMTAEEQKVEVFKDSGETSEGNKASSSEEGSDSDSSSEEDEDIVETETVVETVYHTNNKKIKSFVKKKIADQFNTVGKVREINMPGGKVTIAGGNYGYAVNEKKTVNAIKKAIRSGEDANFEAKYSQKGWGKDKNDDIGDSFIECSIKAQHVWCVVDGNVVVSADCVSGNANEGNDTPTGVFGIMYKESPSVLKGENNDGSTYETPVTYWMPFYADCGFHDATWRSSFGGNIYRGNGSHGCVNMPPAAAQDLYSYVEAGMPVIVHN